MILQTGAVYNSHKLLRGPDLIYLVDGGVHLSPDIQGQVEQQKQEVSHRERGQEQTGVILTVTLTSNKIFNVTKLIFLSNYKNAAQSLHLSFCL